MRFGDSRVQALAGALCATLCAVTGITNRSLARPTYRTARCPRRHDPGLLRPGPAAAQRPDHPPAHAGTDDLTADGLAFAIFYTKVHDRVLAPLFAAGQPQTPPPLRAAMRTINSSSATGSPPQGCPRQPENSAQLSDSPTQRVARKLGNR